MISPDIWSNFANSMEVFFPNSSLLTGNGILDRWETSILMSEKNWMWKSVEHDILSQQDTVAQKRQVHKQNWDPLFINKISINLCKENFAKEKITGCERGMSVTTYPRTSSSCLATVKCIHG